MIDNDFPMEEEMEWADKNGRCVNCFHTLKCCDDKCESENSMEHECESND